MDLKLHEVGQVFANASNSQRGKQRYGNQPQALGHFSFFPSKNLWKIVF